MRPIPLIAGEHLIRITNMVEAAGVSADRHLERARVSPRVREDPSGFLPGRSVWTLVDEVDRGEMLGDFWLDIARISQWRRAGWVRPLAHSVTLLDALRAMCRSYARQIPMNQLGVRREGATAWFWRRRVVDVHDWPGSAPAEQYTLSFMLEVIRVAAGADWLPRRIKVECSESGWFTATNQLRGIDVEYNQPMLALAVPLPLLAVPVSITPLPQLGAAVESPADDFQGTLRQVLRPLISGGLPSQQQAAEMLWTTPRSLRRHLLEEGTCWHAVVSDLKFEKAVERLADGRHTIREIAEELRYSNAAHFTRFFTHRTGVPPSAYREQIERGLLLASERAAGSTPA